MMKSVKYEQMQSNFYIYCLIICKVWVERTFCLLHSNNVPVQNEWVSAQIQVGHSAGQQGCLL